MTSIVHDTAKSGIREITDHVAWVAQAYRSEREGGASAVAGAIRSSIDVLRADLADGVAWTSERFQTLAHKLNPEVVLFRSIDEAYDAGESYGRHRMPTAQETFEAAQRFLPGAGYELTAENLAKFGLSPEGKWLDGRVD